MDDRCRAIVAAIPRAEFERVASGMLGGAAALVGEPVIVTLATTHAEQRTLGVVRVSGSARLEGGAEQAWSSVLKLVDLSQAADNWTQWTRPEIEEVVYQEQYFAGDGSRFRPAHCYLVSKLPDGITIFWLEDLTEARRQPFSLSELAQMAEHLGEWSGRHLTPPPLKFGLPTDIYSVRGNLPVFLKTYEMSKALEPAVFAPYYQDVPIETMHELRRLLRAQNERIKTHPHGLAFGDCQLGNLFFGVGETIAVDWTSLTYDPVGADGGAMIGSAFTWGRGVAEVAQHERELFELYMRGLRTAGWRGTREDLRRGYFCQFGHYLLTGIALMPVLIEREVWPRSALESRLGVSAPEIADLLAPIIALLPGYVEELKKLER